MKRRCVLGLFVVYDIVKKDHLIKETENCSLNIMVLKLKGNR